MLPPDAKVSPVPLVPKPAVAAQICGPHLRTALSEQQQQQAKALQAAGQPTSLQAWCSQLCQSTFLARQ